MQVLVFSVQLSDWGTHKSGLLVVIFPKNWTLPMKIPLQRYVYFYCLIESNYLIEWLWLNRDYERWMKKSNCGDTESLKTLW